MHSCNVLSAVRLCAMDKLLDNKKCPTGKVLKFSTFFGHEKLRQMGSGKHMYHRYQKMINSMKKEWSTNLWSHKTYELQTQ